MDTGAALDMMANLERASSPEAVMRTFGACLSDLGVTAFALGELTNPHQPRSPLAPAPFFVTTWPAEWNQRWMGQDYVRADPVIFKALSAPKPFYWHDIRPSQQGIGARIMDEGGDFGLRDGLCIPIHKPGALTGAVSLAGRGLDFSPEDTQRLHLCAFQMYDKLEHFMRPNPVPSGRPLSDREREVLHWIAAGKSTPAIADILTLSDHTVRGYIKTAMRKLNATTHAQAVAIGIRTGQLLP